MVKFSTLALGLLAIAGEVCAQSKVKVMPFGASIVSRCWRANLQTSLRAGGVTNFDFVGSQKSSCAGTDIDQDHEGHPGKQAAEFVAKGNLTVWLNQNPPDVIIMLLGTNDVIIGKRSVDDILASYDILIGQMRKKNPNMQIVFSNLLPLDPAKWAASAVKGIKDLNTAIATYAPKKSTTKSPVYFVDNFSGFDPVKDADSDGEHPNLTTGVQKMAAKFLDPTKTAIRAAAALKAKRVKRADRMLNLSE
ncbi:cellulose-binding protein [Alternaria alternata]|uniref:Cellulose-binding protein n=1 Tax=Alternaria alternata TaxID=5599 RepID=A0A177D4Y5_ALTAL|nr:cellulose-binding protein [Alternaria alternata]XP_051586440.1 uncharacterized protein J4E82_007550 [Alternaria postmessia]RYO68063.1 hypothetical protein AA0116_g1055 [Alternaria tenuissima]KAI5373737.1 hypothetical protein J4E82_007550 [Alternaria postmessia]OAG14297.1 cellulose-binding protein [Alternaria alternata]RYN71522.1 hypothetical protein AA0117_g9503 [Alternaria alternata]